MERSFDEEEPSDGEPLSDESEGSPDISTSNLMMALTLDGISRVRYNYYYKFGLLIGTGESDSSSLTNVNTVSIRRELDS